MEMNPAPVVSSVVPPKTFQPFQGMFVCQFHPGFPSAAIGQGAGQGLDVFRMLAG